MRKARVLIVEDEPIIAMVLEDMLFELGCEVAATVANVDNALSSLEDGNIDFAILDVSLRQENSYPVAEALNTRGIPFFFSTGYGSLPDGAPAASGLLHKPYQFEELKMKIDDIKLKTSA